MGKPDQKFRSRKRSKRTFHGNQWSKRQEDKQQEEMSSQVTSTTAQRATTTTTPPPVPQAQTQQKVSDDAAMRTPHATCDSSETVHPKVLDKIVTDTPKASDPTIDGNRIIDVSLLGQFLSALCCPHCYKYGLVL